MSTETSEEAQETGSSLRERLESTIETNRKLTEALASKVTEQFRYVKPEDLRDVDFDQMVAKAEEIEAARAAERQEVLREVLAEKGVEPDQLDSALTALLSGETPAPQSQRSASQVASLGKLGGSPPKPIQTEGLFGADKIRAAVAGAK